jgi:methionyl aminopeptidase
MYPLLKKSKARVVPPHIMRPDYADHPEGLPLSEIAEKGTTIIKVLDDEEIEGMRTACKVREPNSVKF